MADIDNTATGGTPTPEGGDRLFTQDDVNRIVQERLAKEKGKQDSAFAERERTLIEREQALTCKELTNQATTRLQARGLSTELLTLVDTSSAEAMERTLGILEKNAPQAAGGYGFGNKQPPSRGDDTIRRSMGLLEKEV